MHQAAAKSDGDGKRVAAPVPVEFGRLLGDVIECVIVRNELRLVVVGERSVGGAVSLHVIDNDKVAPAPQQPAKD